MYFLRKNLNIYCGQYLCMDTRVHSPDLKYYLLTWKQRTAKNREKFGRGM